MESLDKLIIASIDNEKALSDFKLELSHILGINVYDIDVNIGTNLLHSTVTQKLIVTVSNIAEFTKSQLNQIPFTEMHGSDPVIFIFNIGEVSI